MKHIIWLLFLGIGFIYMLDKSIAKDAKSAIYTSIQSIPSKNAALLLGTAKYLKNEQPNYFYMYRIQAAARLWKAGKIKAIIVSGSDASAGYDEVTAMHIDLIRAGVPAQYITRDYAGFRTLDSIVRAEGIYGLEDYIIISQKFHLERALYLAKAKGQKAIGYVAKELQGTTAYYRMKAREYLARVKAFLDVYVLGTEPRVYGEKEKVNYRR